MRNVREGEPIALSPRHSTAHIPAMAKKPDSRKGKDPARVTRAKAAREPLAPIAPALEKLLNPGIAKGTAGVGSQTGLTGEKPAPRSGRLAGEGARDAEPKPDCGHQPTTHGTGARISPPRIGRGNRRGRVRQAHRPLNSPPPMSAANGGG